MKNRSAAEAASCHQRLTLSAAALLPEQITQFDDVHLENLNKKFAAGDGRLQAISILCYAARYQTEQGGSANITVSNVVL